MSFFTEKAGGNGDYVKLNEGGREVTMKITGPARLRYEMYQGAYKETKKGAKIIGSVTPVEVDGVEMQFPDNGTWRLQKAIGEAVLRSGAPDLQVGGTLVVRNTGKEGNAWTYAADYYASEDENAVLVTKNSAPPTEQPADQAQGSFAPAPQQQQSFGQPQQQGFTQQQSFAPQGQQQPQQPGFGQQMPQQGFGQPQQQGFGQMPAAQPQGGSPWV